MAAKKMKKKHVTKKTTTVKKAVKRIVKKTTKKSAKTEKVVDAKSVTATASGEKPEEVSEEELNNFFDDEYPEESDYDSLPKEENKPFQKGEDEE